MDQGAGRGYDEAPGAARRRTSNRRALASTVVADDSRRGHGGLHQRPRRGGQVGAELRRPWPRTPAPLRPWPPARPAFSSATAAWTACTTDWAPVEVSHGARDGRAHGAWPELLERPPPNPLGMIRAAATFWSSTAASISSAVMVLSLSKRRRLELVHELLETAERVLIGDGHGDAAVARPRCR